MLYDLYLFDHSVLHICFWTLPAILTGIVMIVMAVVHNRNQKKREEAFAQELEELKNPTAKTAEEVLM